MRFRIASGLVNAEGRQRALHYRSAWLCAFTTALHETSNGGCEFFLLSQVRFSRRRRCRTQRRDRLGHALRVAMPPAERFNTFKSHP